MRVLVTGAAGLYGHHLVEELLLQQNLTKIIGLDNFSRGFPSEGDDPVWRQNRKFQFIKRNFQDLSVKELNSLNIEAVIHLAGYNSGRESGNTPEEYFLNNEFGTFQFVQTLSRTKNRPFFIFVSTAEIYGKPDYTPVDENHPCNPQNIYAVTKLAAEQHVMAVGKWCNYPVASLRFSNTYGEYQNIYGYTSVTATFIDRALKNEPLIIYGSGDQERDFLYVKDAAKALVLALSRQKDLEGRIINVATGQVLSITKLANLIKDLTLSASEIIKLPCEKTVNCGLPLATQKAQELLGWWAAHSLEEGLANTIKWHKIVQNI
ncbi:MAG: NAD-dependent epimerase/dehydratase family protein [Thermincola sp.]|nr:NAD-dependent epimerase/dehydratase family protein [Thermincola sp.]MDT3702082.1 NAD-dependent epimerase/dehydratase family protein [Thermincola sp.]